MVHFWVYSSWGNPDLSEPLAFKNVSLQMMTINHLLIVGYFFKKLHHIQVLTFVMNS